MNRLCRFFLVLAFLCTQTVGHAATREVDFYLRVENPFESFDIVAAHPFPRTLLFSNGASAASKAYTPFCIISVFNPSSISQSVSLDGLPGRTNVITTSTVYNSIAITAIQTGFGEGGAAAPITTFTTTTASGFGPYVVAPESYIHWVFPMVGFRGNSCHTARTGISGGNNDLGPGFTNTCGGRITVSDSGGCCGEITASGIVTYFRAMDESDAGSTFQRYRQLKQGIRAIYINEGKPF